MGNALQTHVDKAFQNVLEGGSSNGHMKLIGKSTYTATGKDLCPRRLGEGLYLSGKVDNIKVSTQAVTAGLAVCFGEAPQVSVAIQGVYICISSDVPAETRGRAEIAKHTPKQQRDEISADLQKHMANLQVHVSNVVVELNLDGHHIIAYIASAKAEPHNRGRSAAKWQVEHRGIRLELDGNQLVNLSDDTVDVKIAQALRRVDVDLKTEICASLDVEQLLAVLDVVAAAEAIRIIEESFHQRENSDSIVGLPCEVKFLNTLLKLEMNGDPLLEAKSKSGHVSINSSTQTTEILVESVEITRGGSAKVMSDEVRICVEPSGHGQCNRVSLAHNFPSEENGCATLPWRGTLEVLLDDPRFVHHRAWLESARDNKGIDVVNASNKRRLDEGNIENKRPRL